MRNKIYGSVWDWGYSSSTNTLNKVNLDIAKNLYDTSICYMLLLHDCIAASGNCTTIKFQSAICFGHSLNLSLELP